MIETLNLKQDIPKEDNKKYEYLKDDGKIWMKWNEISSNFIWKKLDYGANESWYILEGKIHHIHYILREVKQWN